MGWACCGAGAAASFSLRGVPASEPHRSLLEPRPREKRSKLLERLIGLPGVGLLPRGDMGTRERPAAGLGARCFLPLLPHEKVRLSLPCFSHRSLPATAHARCRLHMACLGLGLGLG